MHNRYACELQPPARFSLTCYLHAWPLSIASVRGQHVRPCLSAPQPLLSRTQRPSAIVVPAPAPLSHSCAAAQRSGAQVELAEPPVDMVIADACAEFENLQTSQATLVQRAQAVATRGNSPVMELAAALREEELEWTGRDFREVANLACLQRRRSNRAAVAVCFPSVHACMACMLPDMHAPAPNPPHRPLLRRRHACACHRCAPLCMCMHARATVVRPCANAHA
jgi:hypothetical protein